MHALARIAAPLLCGLVLLGGAQAKPVNSTETSSGNVYLSGDEVTLSTPVPADLFAAGRRVALEQAVGADASVAGGEVAIRAAIGQDLRVAGGKVEVQNPVGGDLLAAGGSVRLGPGVTVGGDALLAGREVTVDGNLGHGAKVYAGRIVLAGKINGTARLHAPEIEFTPQARIAGDLVYASSKELSLEQMAQVSGKVVREQTPEDWQGGAAVTTAPAGWFHPVFFLSMLVCGALLYLLFPNAVAGARESIRRQPLRSLLLGLALMFTLPPLAILFMITLVGIPIGIGLLALYPLLLLLGYLATAFFVGRRAADMLRQPQQAGKGRQIAYLALALLLLGLVGAVPVLGGVTMFLALVVGIGGWGLWLYQRYRGVPDAGGSAGV